MTDDYESLSWGQKIVHSNKRKHGEDFYEKIGHRGGSSITENTKNRGFGSMTPERRRELGSKGGQTSRRTAKDENQ